MASSHSDGVTIEYDGYLYRTLDSANVSSQVFGTHDPSKPLPSGWEIAPNNDGIVKHVIAMFGWSAAVLAVADNKMYFTGASNLPGRCYLTGRGRELIIEQGLGFYKTPANIRVLMRQKNRKRAHDAHCSELGLHLWSERKFTDCIVACGEKTWSVHRAVLAKYSPVFDRMLSGDMKEAKTQRINITNATSEVVEAMLSFIYTGKLELKADEHTSSLMTLGDYYQIRTLVAVCAEHALLALSIKTALSTVRAFRILRSHPATEGLWDELVAKLASDKQLLSEVLSEL